MLFGLMSHIRKASDPATDNSQPVSQGLNSHHRQTLREGWDQQNIRVPHCRADLLGRSPSPEINPLQDS